MTRGLDTVPRDPREEVRTPSEREESASPRETRGGEFYRSPSVHTYSSRRLLEVLGTAEG
jgi:hypothetical protein